MKTLCTRILSALLIVSITSASVMWTAPACASEAQFDPQARRAAPAIVRQSVELSAEALKFYTAVATVSYWECFRTQDPATCQNFLESLEDPGTHIGFALFVIASRGTNVGMLKLTRGKFAGGGLGIAAGMLANNIFSELYTSAEFKEFRHLDRNKYSTPEARSERRKELVSKLFEETLANKKWWLDQIPSFVGLGGAALLSPLVLPGVSKGLGGAEASIRYFAKDARSAAALSKIRDGIKAYRLAVRAGVGVLEAFETKNPWLFLAGQVGEMVVFLNIAAWIEHPVKKWWSEYRTSRDLDAAISKLEEKLVSASVPGGTLAPQFDVLVREIESDWDSYRASQFFEPLKIQGAYVEVSSSMSAQLNNYYLDYQWVMAGAPSDPEKVPQWQGSVPDGWDINFLTRRDHAFEARRNFFCGEEPRVATKAATHFHGVLVPGKGDRVEPFQVVTNKDLCNGFYFSGDYDQIVLDRKRAEFLKSHNFENELDLAFLNALRGFDRVQSKIISRYDRSIYSSLLDALIGTKERSPQEPVTVGSSKYARGVLPSYKQELEYWEVLSRRFPEQRTVLDAAADRTRKKSEAANSLLEYLMAPDPLNKKFLLASSAFKGVKEKGIFEDEDDTTPEDWQKIVQVWKGFLLGPKGR